VNGKDKEEGCLVHNQKSDDEEEMEPRTRTKRVELPIFEGMDLQGWISCTKKFFEIHKVLAKERLGLALINTEGNASHWFNFCRQNSKNPSWNEFSLALIWRFEDKERSSVFERLARLKQDGRVEEHIQELEVLVDQAPTTTKEQLLGYFFAGL